MGHSRRLRGSCRESAPPSIADVMLQHTVNGARSLLERSQ